MDERTGEIFKFPSQEDLEKARKDNPFMIEVDCNKGCDFREIRNEKTFCIANRMQRRLIKCQVKRR